MKRHRIWFALVVALGALAGPVYAQRSDQPTHIPTRRDANSPFGTDWAKPGGTTGSYIYNDPRLRDPNSSQNSTRNTRCPAPLLFDPASGRCR